MKPPSANSLETCCVDLKKNDDIAISNAIREKMNSEINDLFSH